MSWLQDPLLTPVLSPLVAVLIILVGAEAVFAAWTTTFSGPMSDAEWLARRARPLVPVLLIQRLSILLLIAALVLAFFPVSRPVVCVLTSLVRGHVSQDWDDAVSRALERAVKRARDLDARIADLGPVVDQVLCRLDRELSRQALSSTGEMSSDPREFQKTVRRVVGIEVPDIPLSKLATTVRVRREICGMGLRPEQIETVEIAVMRAFVAIHNVPEQGLFYVVSDRADRFGWSWRLLDGYFRTVGQGSRADIDVRPYGSTRPEIRQVLDYAPDAKESRVALLIEVPQGMESGTSIFLSLEGEGGAGERRTLAMSCGPQGCSRTQFIIREVTVPAVRQARAILQDTSAIRLPLPVLRRAASLGIVGESRVVEGATRTLACLLKDGTEAQISGLRSWRERVSPLQETLRIEPFIPDQDNTPLPDIVMDLNKAGMIWIGDGALWERSGGTAGITDPDTVVRPTMPTSTSVFLDFGPGAKTPFSLHRLEVPTYARQDDAQYVKLVLDEVYARVYWIRSTDLLTSTRFPQNTLVPGAAVEGVRMMYDTTPSDLARAAALPVTFLAFDLSDGRLFTEPDCALESANRRSPDPDYFLAVWNAVASGVIRSPTRQAQAFQAPGDAGQAPNIVLENEDIARLHYRASRYYLCVATVIAFLFGLQVVNGLLHVAPDRRFD